MSEKKTAAELARKMARSLEHNQECDLYECADCASAILLRRLAAQSEALRELYWALEDWAILDCTSEMGHQKIDVARVRAREALDGE